MDLTTLIVPAAQQLASSVLGETWNGVRDAIARRLGRGHTVEIEKAAAELDATASRALAEQAAGDGEALVTYWATYLEALVVARPDLADLLKSLAEGSYAQPRVEVRNQVNGTIYGKSAIVGGDVHGGISM